MIENIEKYKDNKEIYFMLQQLEIALKTKDDFSASILLKRLENANLVLKPIDNDDQPVVQWF